MELENNTVSTPEMIPPLKSVYVKPTVARLITSAQNAKGKPMWLVGGDHTLSYCVSGTGVMHINGQYYLVRPGQLAFNPKDTQRGRIPLSDDWVLHEVFVTGAIEEMDIAEYLHLTEGNYIVNLPENYKNLASICFDQALAVNRSPEGYLFRAAAIINLLGIFFDARMQMENTENMFSSVLAYMHEHLDSSVSLPELASLMHMQPAYFIRIFKKMFLQTPISYFNTLRVIAAIELLSATALPLSEIAAKIGISDPYHFSNFFKTRCGISPNYYREYIKGIKKQIEASV